jgi:MoxR-like ATPase
LATQNPIEQEGVFPLPEAQLDRFLFCLHLGYPSLEEEKSMLRAYRGGEPIHSLKPLLTPAELTSFKALCAQIRVEAALQNYLIDICRATRVHKAVTAGASPRASLGFFYASRALAALRGRDYVTPDDIKYLGERVLSHRLVLKPRERMGGLTASEVVREILETTAVPMFGEGDDYAG